MNSHSPCLWCSVTLQVRSVPAACTQSHPLRSQPATQRVGLVWFREEMASAEAERPVPEPQEPSLPAVQRHRAGGSCSSPAPLPPGCPSSSPFPASFVAASSLKQPPFLSLHPHPVPQLPRAPFSPPHIPRAHLSPWSICLPGPGH